MKCPFHKLMKPFNKTLQIGWLRDNADAAAIYFPPERIIIKAHKNATLARCPATQDHRKNRFLIRSPIDLHIKMVNGQPSFVKGPGEPGKRFDMFVVEEKPRWLDPSRPVIQLKLPYAFVSDQPGIHIRTTPPYEMYGAANFPGTLVAGDFDIYDWPLRNINWSFEWHDTTKDILVNRGDPLFVVEFPNTEQKVELVEMHYNVELSSLMRSVHDVTGYVNFGTRDIMKMFGLHRPKKIIPLGLIDT